MLGPHNKNKLVLSVCLVPTSVRLCTTSTFLYVATILDETKRLSFSYAELSLHVLSEHVERPAQAFLDSIQKR